MPKTKASQKKKQKKRTRARVKKAKAAATKKRVAKRKGSRRKKVARGKVMVQLGSQSVETVNVRPKERAMRAGVGAGDYQGASLVENVDSESEEELLEEGQAFEAGIVRGVESAKDADAGEVITREVPQNDVPEEYEDQERS